MTTTTGNSNSNSNSYARIITSTGISPACGSQRKSVNGRTGNGSHWRNLAAPQARRCPPAGRACQGFRAGCQAAAPPA
ncbi:hypothetical protein BL250_08740 [Erwinia sp. OLTSP20]|nr:hypothetical protein BV501_10300 [Erwinia sp. OAMSP11]PIJ72444.1 hypothetical protein BK416_09495 [Erwinia sp. OLSSP12]PIJ80067.1 hypothetical protein BLD47_12065 [Erwinia sp. OLCASP19]PIJ82135.1 hypothetical protein BLD46_11670 [Erwinia sp. OLMTSP26]PIJ86371.1 hypothetical protein BLD49_08365 [Erwinia sp. OLMDSP33]PIJ89732.1 hypothetical protein BL249_15165 [Erwinia sp. OLFS4]PIJ92666.1 hypothetical protein BL250_08740 [Erwinia sp. OLTSP20]